MFLSFLRFASFSEKSGILLHDKLRLSIKAGNGGCGLARYNGIGGNGGNVIFIAKSNVTFPSFLKKFQTDYTVKGENGANSVIVNLVGKHGSDKILEVPLGIDCVNEVDKMLVARCNKHNQRYLIAKGGLGGCASNNYQGRRGERFLLTIHLKVKANVGFLGFPNAGKSTLLKALVPKKKIKIAPYPFTTLRPQVCHFKYPTDNPQDFPFSLTFADLPGLIEGAHVNRGKGYEFLKHLEYSDIIVMVIDISGFFLSNSNGNIYRNPLECISILNQEVERYNYKLLNRPVVLVLNKIDIPDGEKIADGIKEAIEKRTWFKNVPEDIRPANPIYFQEIVKTSAKEGRLNNFQEIVRKLYDEKYPLRTLDDIKFSDNDENSLKII
ncbi:Mitochondrial ribosome-associated GTPase 2 [Strongyloides ratti]|uniref:Mitochondrial ribosome-associated GTPase 2 n=1 Tax=Strongyloides ratti TaxID=34506 RepID=A0A090LLA1_STRRB|nr:Mitochondrial ribosome-associated GTPase 2 [Strongyloides ratti]CEF68310.1 Mitochondrial ribosome-associated GTPase 2 [Strongyloides ratti]